MDNNLLLAKKALKLGFDCYQRSDFANAEILFQKVLQIEPKSFDAHHLLGVLRLRAEQFSSALPFLKNAVLLRPNDGDANHHLALALKGLNDYPQALSFFSNALRLKPALAPAHLGRADVLSGLRRYEEAVIAYKQAIKYDKRLLKAHNNLGTVYRKQSKLLEAISCYQAAYDLDTSRLDIFSNILMCMAYCPDIRQSDYLCEAKRYGALASHHATPFSSWPLTKKRGSKSLRVGFVSGDFRKHSVAYFLKSWLDKIDPNKVKMFAYSNFPVEDSVTKELKVNFEKWRNIYDEPDKQVAQLIYEDKINILIDLSGHTAYNRLPLFAWKAAPVQASWIGFFASTGVAEIDYFIGDKSNFPDSFRQYYTETPWLLNQAGCLSPPETGTEVAELPALKNGYVTFGCFHKVAKLNDDVVALWAKLLQQNTTAKLLFKDIAFADVSLKKRIQSWFSDYGVKPNRIECEVGEERELYLKAYDRIDIGLDPFPYSGGTVNAESLWMGVPYISLMGERRISRFGGKTLIKAGLDQFVANTQDEYLAIANKACAEIETLSEIRAGLREKVAKTVLFDGALMARDLEESFQKMWFKYVN